MTTETVIPPGGTPGTFDSRNPTLLPNFDTPTEGLTSYSQKAQAISVVGSHSPAGFLRAVPRVEATATATFGGSATSGDILTVEYTNLALQAQGVAGGKISHTYTVGASDTLDDIAENFADLFNDDTIAQNANIRADAVGAVLTFRHAGPVGNFSVLTAPVLEPAKLTVAGTAHTGDVFNALFTGPLLPVGGVLIQANSTTGNTATQDASALNTVINANATLSAAGISSTPTAGVLALTMPAGDYQVVAWVNSATPAYTVGGTPAATNTLTATFTNATLPGGAYSVVYTVPAAPSPTTTTVAAGLAALINADAVLIAAGITASPSAAVVTISYPANIGQLRFSTSATGGGATLTAIANPTATLTRGTTATETITFSNSGKLSGGDGPVFATNNFEFALGSSQVQAFWYGKPYVLGYDVLTQMVSQGMPLV